MHRSPVSGLRALLAVAIGLMCSGNSVTFAQSLPDGDGAAQVDLLTREGVASVDGAWRYHDVELVGATHRAPDANGQPTGAAVGTWDIAPHAGDRGYDDASWTVLDPTTLGQRRGN